MSSSKKDLKSIYDAAVSRPLAKSSKKSEPSFKPSMLGSPCLRKVSYSYNKVPEDIPFPLRSSRITKLGDAVGKMLFETFEAQGAAIRYRQPDGSYFKDYDGNDDYEFRVSSEELGVRLGKLDLVSVLDDGLWVGEIKSINDRGYRELKAPKGDHLIQGVLYLYLFNKALRGGEYAHIKELEGHKEALGVRFLYYNKNVSEMKEFVVTSADDTFRHIVTKIETVKNYVKNDVLPPKTPDYCGYCPWQVKCRDNKKS